MAIFPSATSKFHTTAYQSILPSRPELSAKGKNVLITGGGSGIGAATARAFAQAGASRIALLGRRAQPLLDTKTSIEEDFDGVKVFVFSADVTKKVEVDDAFANFVGDGKLDVVISNAAVVGPLEPLDSVDNDKFMEGVNDNIRGSLNVAQAFLRHASSKAVAIEINSCVVHVNFGAGMPSYTVAKMAAFRLWDFLAAAHPEYSVFHVQPGVVDTSMSRLAGGVELIGHEDHVSLPANFNVWLASPEATFLKGKYLWANWDVDELKARAKELESSSLLTIGLAGWPFQDDK